MIGSTTRAAALAIAALAALAGCSDSSPDPGVVHGTTLTIYTSVPLDGLSSLAAQAVISGEEMALADAHSRVGKYRIVFKPLDDSTPARGGWDPGQTTLNAHDAVADPTTIAYIGEFDSGATAVSLPILNRAGIPQISPTATAVGLTTAGSGAQPGEPQKYYPSGVRTFARVVPSDAVQAGALVELLESKHCKRTFVLDDGAVDGYDAAASFQVSAQSTHLPLAGVQQFDPRAGDYSALAGAVAQAGADCVVISASPETHAVLVTEQVAAADPTALIFGTAQLAQDSYADPAQGGIPTSLDDRVFLTTPALGAADYPPGGRAFLAAYRERFGDPQLTAIFGYEAMSLMLASVARATHGSRKAVERSSVIAALLHTRNRRSVLGIYSIDAGADTSLHAYGVYGLDAGRLEFVEAISA